LFSLRLKQGIGFCGVCFFLGHSSVVSALFLYSASRTGGVDITGGLDEKIVITGIGVAYGTF
jgi:hypothetical protein